MPLGDLLDQWEIYKQFHGLAKPKREYGIDEIIFNVTWCAVIGKIIVFYKYILLVFCR